MKHVKHFFLAGIIMSFFISPVLAQHTSENEEKFSPHSSQGIVLGHAHLSDGRDENGKKKTVSLPSWGIDYNYCFHPNWAIGLHTDFIFEKFRVADEDGITVERSTPVAPAIMAIFKPNHHWNFLFGAGEEFAKEGNFFLNRLGIEYGAEIRKENIDIT